MNAAMKILIPSIFTLLGGILGAVISGYYQISLERTKLNSEIIKLALTTEQGIGRLNFLNLIAETRLLKDEEIEEAILEYTKKMINNPNEIPQIVSVSAEKKAIRVYLLSGKERKYDEDIVKLAKLGYDIVGARQLNDDTRPPHAEVRYYNEQDLEQAQSLSKLYGIDVIQLKNDADALPGYIEIWFGR